MTTFLLIRHGMTSAVGVKIVGRLPGISLNAEGRAQAEGLAARLSRWKIDALYSSPLERTMETAAAVSRQLGLAVKSEPAFAEFDFGDWTGCTIADLDQRRDWQLFNQFRSSTRAPGGELVTEVQTRMVTALTALKQAHSGETVAVVSHADAIKATLLHYLPAPLDHMHRLEIHPASISVLRLEDWGAVISAVNLAP